jgi:hypothetical protein
MLGLWRAVLGVLLVGAALLNVALLRPLVELSLTGRSHATGAGRDAASTPWLQAASAHTVGAKSPGGVLVAGVGTGSAALRAHTVGLERESTALVRQPSTPKPWVGAGGRASTEHRPREDGSPTLRLLSNQFC